MTTLSVSSYSLREQLGPLAIAFTDDDGREHTFRQAFPQLLEITEFPARAAAALAVGGVETVAFQYGGLDDPTLDSFATQARDAGLQLVNLAVDDGDLLSSDDERRERDVARLEQWVERAAALGFHHVRVNPGSPFGSHAGGAPPAHLVAALRRLGEHARGHGIRLLVENHGGPSSDPTWMLALLDAVGSDLLGLLLDLGNFDVVVQPALALLLGGPEAASGDDPWQGLDLTPVYEGIEALAPRAELVHVKVHRVQGSEVGPVDVPRALGILAEHGYAGPLTVEYEGHGGDPWASTRAVVELAAGRAVGA